MRWGGEGQRKHPHTTLTIAVFAVLALAVRGVERLLGPGDEQVTP